MKSKDKKVLLVGAGAVGLLALAVYASQGAGAEPLNLGGGGGVAGGGMPAVFAGGVDGTGDGTGQAEVTYNVAFPDVQVPAMPAIPVYTDDPLRTTKKGFIPANIPGNDTGKSYSMTVMGPAKTVSDLNTPESRAAYSAVVASGATPGDVSGIPGGNVSGIPGGGSSTKKGANVGADTAPGGLPGLVGNLIGGIGGLFGW